MSLKAAMRACAGAAVVCAWVSGGVAPAVAQDYPSKPVKLLVPYAPGGTPDVVGRIIGLKLSEALGQQFVVDNRPGAGGIPATVAAAKAPPDGYTLLVADIAQIAINPFLFKTLPYDPIKDLTPISLLATTPVFIAAHPVAKIGNVQELVNAAKAKPGALNYGSAGIGSVHHILMESFKSALALDIVHVPFKGSGQSVPAFLSGEVSLVVSALPSLAAHVKSGRAQLLANASRQRSPLAPDVPAVSETVPGFDFPSEVGLLAPAGTAPAIIQKLAAVIQNAVKQPDTVQKFANVGSDPVGSTPEAFAENIQHNLVRYSKAVKLSGAKVE